MRLIDLVRENFAEIVFAGLESSVVGIEACHSSHYWGRELIKLGHTVRLLPTQYVKPFVVGGKNDANDAAVICTAVTRRDIHTVPVKSAEQQSLQSLHRMREKAIQERTAKSNQIRSMFSEEGHIFPAGLPSLRKGILTLMDDGEAGLTPILKRLGQMYLEQMGVLKAWLDELDSMIDDNFKNNETYQRLATIPRIGPIIATAMVGLVEDPAQFKTGRRFAAWLSWHYGFCFPNKNPYRPDGCDVTQGLAELSPAHYSPESPPAVHTGNEYFLYVRLPTRRSLTTRKGFVADPQLGH
ncbi:IS110 family transposase [Salmonella enterica]|nr:IS110 family transposase [Salmonella enterica]ECC3860928.1 IS110 family transposase [Salmonella enterica subsp. enterica]EAV7001792.1 IS110 family transposase [Salmonella enterica]EDT6851602.1 IS110 family transposase [Salmonella enterica subsp. enterica]EEH7186343.1 IS110 family transposase [Salmonella enterica subsp. enterica]